MSSRSTTIPDRITQASGGGGTAQDITTDSVADVVWSLPDGPYTLGGKGEVIEIDVETTAADGDEGVDFEIRVDTAASLASGSQIVIASRRVLPAALVAGNKIVIPVPVYTTTGSTFLYWGVYYNVVSTAFTALGVITSLKHGGETINT